MTANCGGDVPTCPVRTVEGFAGALRESSRALKPS